MIIRMIATALIQCITRTQPGWMTLEVALVAACCSVAARLVMMFPSLRGVTSIYAESRHFVTVRNPSQPPGHPGLPGDCWSQKCEPGFTPARGFSSGRRQQHGVDHMDHAVRLMDVGDGD